MLRHATPILSYGVILIEGETRKDGFSSCVEPMQVAWHALGTLLFEADMKVSAPYLSGSTVLAQTLTQFPTVQSPPTHTNFPYLHSHNLDDRMAPTTIPARKIHSTSTCLEDHVKALDTPLRAAVAACSKSGGSAPSHEFIQAGHPKHPQESALPERRTSSEYNELIWLGEDPHSPPISVKPSPIGPLAPAIELTQGFDQTAKDVRADSPYDSPTSLIYYHHHPSCSTIASCDKSSAASRSCSSFSALSACEAKIIFAERATRKKPCHLIDLRQNLKVDTALTARGDDGDFTHVAVTGKEHAIPPSPSGQAKMSGWDIPHAPATPWLDSSPYSPAEDQMLTPTLIDPDPHTPRRSNPRTESSSHPFLQGHIDVDCRHLDAQGSEARPLALANPEDIDRMLVEVDNGTFGEKDSLQELVERTGKVAKILRTRSL
ncbi:hypothetical protein I317_02123 [Kwoniella heveanensis CBS 569]|nr:hypothetical protein I317_02123 [Kwoniella heveanensis CBS 569]